MQKIILVIRLAKANGFRWLMLVVLERLSKVKYQQRRLILERDELLPGFNPSFYNSKEWSHYNWASEGEEWSDSAGWKASLVEEFIHRYFQKDKCIVEIGPGGGKWSVELAPIAGRLILVDLIQQTLDHCKKRLSTYTNCEYYRNNGSDLSILSDNSVDYIWSFDVFVHISPKDAASYIHEFSRVMKTAGVAIIHHPAAGGVHGGYRSSITNKFFKELLEANGFLIIDQRDQWGGDNQYDLKMYGDMITVFIKH